MNTTALNAPASSTTATTAVSVAGLTVRHRRTTALEARPEGPRA
ncbi:hypothetical protein AB0P36_11560 [Streptomyces flavidovirens]